MLASHTIESQANAPDLAVQFKQLAERYTKLAQARGFEGLYTRCDPEIGLFAIVAIHSTTRGPAIGGCRCLPYASMDAAFEDALRLGKTMSYKAALHQLPHGGAKAVLIRPPKIHDRKAYFQAFADFVDTLEGRYLTSLDSGTETADLDIISTHTKHVLGTTHQQIDPADSPSPYTAIGAFESIQAVNAFLWPDRPLNNLHVCIQGIGHVGTYLAQLLHASGVQLTVVDIDSALTAHCQEHYGAQVALPDAAHRVQCDIFSPCALGNVLNAETIPEIAAAAVVGAANNQLSTQADAFALAERNILYAPDFLVSGGGLIHVASLYNQLGSDITQTRIKAIRPLLTQILEQAKMESRTPHHIASDLADLSLRTHQSVR